MRKMFETSAETSALVELFKSLEPGQGETFEQASKVFGFDLSSTTGAYHSARRIAARDLAIVIEGVRGVGFIRLTPDQIAEATPRGINSIRRRARRETGKIEIALGGVLSNINTHRAHEAFSRYRMLGDIASPGWTNRPARERPEEQISVDPRKVLRVV
jgi:hypothetical protein